LAVTVAYGLHVEAVAAELAASVGGALVCTLSAVMVIVGVDISEYVIWVVVVVQCSSLCERGTATAATKREARTTIAFIFAAGPSHNSSDGFFARHFLFKYLAHRRGWRRA